MTATEKVQSIQTILGVTPDGLFFDKSKAALSELLDAAAIERRSSVAADNAPDVDFHASIADASPVDARSEANIATLHPKVQPLARALVNRAASVGIKAVITSGTRTYAEQDALYEQGRSKPGRIVTNARGGFSNHNHGLAFDVTVFEGASPKWEGPEYKTLGKIGETLGLSWGGRWTSPVDEPHYELRPSWADDLSESQMLAELRSRHSSGTDAFA